VRVANDDHLHTDALAALEGRVQDDRARLRWRLSTQPPTPDERVPYVHKRTGKLYHVFLAWCGDLDGEG
jgi:hypothetical protein